MNKKEFLEKWGAQHKCGSMTRIGFWVEPYDSKERILNFIQLLLEDVESVEDWVDE